MWIEAESQVCLQPKTVCNVMILADFIVLVSSHLTSEEQLKWWHSHSLNPFSPLIDGCFGVFLRTHFSLSASLSKATGFPGTGPSLFPPPHQSQRRTQTHWGLMSAAHAGRSLLVRCRSKANPFRSTFCQYYISLWCCFQYGYRQMIQTWENNSRMAAWPN